MAISSVTEIWSGRTASQDASAEETYTKVYRIISDVINEEPVLIWASGDLPVIGDSYSSGDFSNPRCRVVRRELDQDDENPFIWFATLEYSSEIDDLAVSGVNGVVGGNGTDRGNLDVTGLVDRRTRRSMSFHKFQRPALKDKDDKPVKNSAGDFYDPVIQIDDSRPIIRFVRNELSFQPAFWAEFRDSVNSEAWAGQEPGRAKMNSITTSGGAG